MRVRRAIAHFGIASLLCAQATIARAAGWPERPVRIVVPFAAGGGTDIVTRVLSERLGQIWQQSVVVDNRPGATGVIAAQAVAHAAADGYTILVGTASTHAVLPALKPNLPYDNVKDFTPITLLGTTPYVLVVNPKLPATSIPELIALLKANPDKYSYASAGVGSLPHLAAELFKAMSGTSMVHVPYKGSGPGTTDTIAGQVQVTFDTIPSLKPYIDDKLLRPLGVTSKERANLLPAVPPISEHLAGYQATSWIGLLAPAGTPNDIVSKIAQDAQRVLEAEDIVKRMTELGSDRRRHAALADRRENRERGAGLACGGRGQHVLAGF